MSPSWQRRRSSSRRTAASEHTRSAIEGRRRWLERMRAAKERGEIEKIPGGRKPGVRGRIRSPDPRSARLERMAERTIDELLAALDEGRLELDLP